MRMLLERAAGFFQAQGWRVVVNPCVIGDSGAIHTPDLQLLKDGEKPRVAFVLDALDGHVPLEQRAHMAKDMGLQPVFVVGDPSPEVRGWAERHHHELVLEDALPAAPPPGAALATLAAPATPAMAELPPAPEPDDDGGAMLLPSAVAAPISPPAPAAPEDDGGAVLLTATAARPRAPARALPPPAETEDDGGVELLGSRAARAPIAAPVVASERAAAWEAAAAESNGAELLPSLPSNAQDAEKVAKHDLSIWDPRARLAQVKQAAKALSFETTAGPSASSSAWLNGLRRRD
jgi:hypothetical protein